MCDFAPNRLLCQQFWTFIGQQFKNTEHLRQLTRSWENQHFISAQEAKLNPIPISITPICKIDLFESITELARQLTLLEFGLFEKIFR